MRPAGSAQAFLGGFVAAEGCFTRSANTFSFAIALAAKDAGMCEFACANLGVGHVRVYPRRKAHYDDEVVYSVRRTEDLVTVVVPFMDAWLPPSAKLEQYLHWRTELLDHWEHTARRRRLCTVDGCDAPQRGKGVCRRHYYARFGR